MKKKKAFFQKKLPWYQLLRILLQLSYFAAMVFALLGRNFAVAISLMVLALVSGSWFCGWLCPFGTIQEWLGRLGNRLFGRKFRVPRHLEKYLRSLRYLLLAAGMGGLMFLGFLSSPYNTSMGIITGTAQTITVTAWGLLALFLVSSLVIDRPFCRYFCTEGARYGILSLGRLFTIRRDETSCVDCGACDRACPSQIDVASKRQVRNAQCINCMECINACPKSGTLSFGFAFTGNRKKENEDEGI